MKATPKRRGSTQAQAPAGAQPEGQVLVGLARLGARHHRQAAAHPEVDDQGLPLGEVDQQVLAAPAQALDAAARGVAREPAAVERLAQRRGVDLDRLDPVAGQERLEAAAQDLDLGKLGHRVRMLAGSGAAEEPAGSRTGDWAAAQPGRNSRAQTKRQSLDK